MITVVGMKETPPSDPSKNHRLAFSVAETAHLLGISQPSVRRLLGRGLLKSSKALRHKLIPRSEIEKLLRDTL